MTATPDPPVPAGATAGDWITLDDDSDLTRPLTWTHHDTDKIEVIIDGWQYADGHVQRCISLYDTDGKELAAKDARQLATALLEAADELEHLDD